MQLKDIKNQRVLLNELTEIIDFGRVSHAQLVVGESSSGSLAIALAYMQYLSCQHRCHYEPLPDGGYRMPDGGITDLRADSCGECSSCKKFQSLSHSDLHFFFPTAVAGSVKSKPSSEDFRQEFVSFLEKHGQYGSLEEWYVDLGIENKQGMIREKDADDIIKSLLVKPYEGKYKMIVIWCAEKMNIPTANALLKSLEEPLGQTLIFLVCETTERLLPTIMSRVQQIVVPSLKGGVADNNAQFAQWFLEWMRMLFKLNMARLSEWVDRIAKIGREPQKQFLKYSLEALRRCFLCSVTGNEQHLFDFGDERFNKMFYSYVTVNNIASMNDAINEALMSIERNANPSITFMSLSFQLSKWIKKR